MRPLQYGRRRKRDSTTQAVDFLNSVNNNNENKNANTAPPGSPARQRPNKRRRTYRSRDVFDIPLSPDEGSRHIEDSDYDDDDDDDDDDIDPVTPRRSTRLHAQQQNHVTDTSTRRSLRFRYNSSQDIEDKRTGEDSSSDEEPVTSGRSTRPRSQESIGVTPAERFLQFTRDFNQIIEDDRTLEDRNSDNIVDTATPRRSSRLEAQENVTDTPARRSLRFTRDLSQEIEEDQARENRDSDRIVEHVTPRRSSRLETREHITDTPTGRSLRSTRNPTERVEDAPVGEDDDDGDELFSVRFSNAADSGDQYSLSASARSSSSESFTLASPSKLFHGQGVSSDSETNGVSRAEQGLGSDDSSQDESDDDVADDDKPGTESSSAPQRRDALASSPSQESRGRSGSSPAGHVTPRRAHNGKAAEDFDAPSSSTRRHDRPRRQSDIYETAPPTSNTHETRNTASRYGHQGQTAERPSHAGEPENSNVESSHGISVSVFKQPERAGAYLQAQGEEVPESSYYETSGSSSESGTDTDGVSSTSESEANSGSFANDAEDETVHDARTIERIGRAVNNTELGVDRTEPVAQTSEVYYDGHTIGDTEDEEDSEEWFKEAQDLGGQKGNWNALIKRTRLLKRTAEPESRKHFEGVVTLISELGELYRNLPNTIFNARSASRAVSHECHNLVDGISREGFGILVKAWYLAAGDRTSPKRKLRAKCLVNEFEAHVIPEMVKLALGCFKAFYNDHQLALGGDEQLLGVLKLILSFSDRIFNLVVEGIVKSRATTRHIRLPIRGIIEALESGDFERKPAPRRRREVSVESERNGGELDDESDSSVSSEMGPEKKWTEDEGNALVQGLKLYQGPNRYVQIVRHFGDRLRGRSLKELQAKAKQIREKNVPNLGGQLQTRHGRQALQWLLSV